MLTHFKDRNKDKVHATMLAIVKLTSDQPEEDETCIRLISERKLNGKYS